MNLASWTKVFILRAMTLIIFQQLEAVSRYRDPQLQVTKNKFNLQNLGWNVYDYYRFETYLIFKTWLYKTIKT